MKILAMRPACANWHDSAVLQVRIEKESFSFFPTDSKLLA